MASASRISVARRALWRRLSETWAEWEYALTVLAAVIGLVTGLGAIGFSALIELVRDLYYRHAGGALHAYGLYLWLLPLLPMTGGLLVGLITHFFAPEAEGHGVPEVMDAMARRSGRIRPRVAGAKAVASALTIGSGGSAGTEGPIIQIGAAVGSSVGQWLRLPPGDLRVLIGCGAAAGIASIFNAPIAGVLFAIEVLLRDVSLRSFLPIIISAVASSTVTQAVRGDLGPIFPVPSEFASGTSVYTFSVRETANYAVLGLLCGLVALTYVRLLYLTEDLFRKMPGHRVARPVVGALLLGLLAVGTHALIADAGPAAHPVHAPRTAEAARVHPEQPPIMGNGYPIIGRSLDPQAYETGGGPAAEIWSIRILLVLLVTKIIATCLTLGSGGSGGVFAPSLFIGATTGGAFGLAVHATGWFPGVNPGAYALVGMAAVVAASIHAPLTAGIMLFELTGDYEVIVPIMLAGVIGLAVAKYLEPASIYTLKLLRRGVDIHKGQDISLLRHLLVRDALRNDGVTVPPTAGLTQVIARLVEHPGYSVFVVDDARRLCGVIPAHEMRTLMADANTYQDLLIAEDIMQERDFPTVRPTDTLADVMKRLARYRGEVPVVEDGRLVGAIWPEDVIERYNAELFKRDMAASMASTLSGAARVERIPALEQTSLAEIPVPPQFIGRSLGSLAIRNRYQVTILMIKHSGGAGAEPLNAVPAASYVFQPGDILLAMGPDERLRQLERGIVESV